MVIAPVTREDKISIPDLGEQMVKELGEYYGNKKLGGVRLLIESLGKRLGVEEVTWQRNSGSGSVTNMLNKWRVYMGVHGSRTLVSSGGKSPSYRVVVVGPAVSDEGKKALRLYNILPLAVPRDFEEQAMLGGINERLGAQLSGDHGVGELVVPDRDAIGRYERPTYVHQTFTPNLKVPFCFDRDIERLLLGTEVYEGFLELQDKRKQRVVTQGKDLVEEIVKGKPQWLFQDLPL